MPHEKPLEEYGRLSAKMPSETASELFAQIKLIEEERFGLQQQLDQLSSSEMISKEEIGTLQKRIAVLDRIWEKVVEKASALKKSEAQSQ